MPIQDGRISSNDSTSGRRRKYYNSRARYFAYRLIMLFGFVIGTVKIFGLFFYQIVHVNMEMFCTAVVLYAVVTFVAFLLKVYENRALTYRHAIRWARSGGVGALYVVSVAYNVLLLILIVAVLVDIPTILFGAHMGDHCLNPSLLIAYGASLFGLFMISTMIFTWMARIRGVI
jgi:hypothetical protein